MKPQRYGFTIVELLIVIVVIAILAAISIVAFNGIQTRAENAKTTNAVADYTKALMAYGANGSYPTGTFVCFGAPSSGKCGNITDTYTGDCGGNSAPGTVSTSFDTAVKTITGSTLPAPSTQTLSCGGKSFAGAHYFSMDGKLAMITYYLRGNQTCGGIGGLSDFFKYQSGDATACSASLPTLP